ncbi:hypothetical protein [Cellulomonas sp. B6]|uniref:hypothetical protein n=1 Tax=Cellulomonas sp. B6 TaxID=1295626 RepID=UPI00073B04F5|nr:hypothetical protein [Cellulomonas sp. B6]KSW23785.1 hypothetical protein ATM99_12470 [Cellulomonas sp. B6]
MREALPVVVLVLGAVYVLAYLPAGPLFRWRLRRRMVRMLDPGLPPLERERAVEVVRRTIPLRGRVAGADVERLPARADPTELRVLATVPPTPDGCPGFRVWLPWHSSPAADAGSDGSRQVVTVHLGSGRALLVVVLGRVGRVDTGTVLATAADRPALGRALGVHTYPVGEVLRAATAAGPAWRHTFGAGSTVVTDTHVDRDGWAFVVGLVRRDGDHGVDGLDDAVLATWEWIPADGLAADGPAADRAAEDGLTAHQAAAAGPAGPACPGAAEPGAVPAAPVEVALADEPGSTAARCRVPCAPTAAGVPGSPGTWTAAYVRLSPTASLVVAVHPADPGVPPRDALAVPEVVPWGPGATPTGDVRERTVAAGTVATRTWHVAGLVRTEARLDRRGRTWRWLLTYAPDETAALAVLEDALQTWRWED